MGRGFSNTKIYIIYEPWIQSKAGTVFVLHNFETLTNICHELVTYDQTHFVYNGRKLEGGEKLAQTIVQGWTKKIVKDSNIIKPIFF